MIAAHANKAHRDESIAVFVLRAASLLFVVSISALLIFLLYSGLQLFVVNHVNPFTFLSATGDIDSNDTVNTATGAWPFIVGSLFVTAFAIVVGGPIGLFVGVFFAELAPKRVAALFKPAIEMLVGIPSVVYGWIGLVVLVPFINAHNPLGVVSPGNYFAAGIVLSIMILPTVISLAEDALKVVPPALREGSLALGATRWQTIYRVILPAARSGLAVAIILGIARAIGETMAVQLVIGNSPTVPATLFNSGSSLTAYIVSNMSDADGAFRNSLFAMALLLLLIAMTLVLITKFALRKRS